MFRKSVYYIGACSLALLTACGSDDDGNNHTSSSSSAIASSSSSVSSEISSSSSSESSSSLAQTELNGLAAVGAAITNAIVTANCADGTSFTTAVTTNSQGAFSGTVATGALPCALQVTGGTPSATLHSYTNNGGRVNITPFTDMVIANATNMNPEQWFINPDWTLIDNNLTAATGEIQVALIDAGFTLPTGEFLPFTDDFAIGDAWDIVLDALQLAIETSASIQSYPVLLEFISQGSLTLIPPPAVSSSSSSVSSVSSSSSSVSSPSSSSSSSVITTGDARQCFNPELSAEDTHIISEYRATDSASGGVINFTYDQTIHGLTTFNGNQVRYAVSDTVATGVAPSRSTTTSYFTVDESNSRSEAAGVEVEVTSPINSTTVTSNSPFMLTRYDLSAGQSHSQTYTSSTQVMGIDITTSINFTRTFTGFEDITVPAGSYSACRFDIDQDGELTTRWVAVGSGIELKVVSGGDETVFVSGTLNGTNL
ncbi:hypothetical protein QWI17_16895 [Gilvimarinus sp. SDUM040013]|uniref:Lipoprotein n=1 Tax=Gilvimarinus gilvus TaxID=3058038 RepID=A0ABU4S513_9GAMM|nr:hypothetical protein [Gilvimarinus sp. SDUM040013]MDO3387522.1 hypothetical protein [Gilvimarinus sp. SDUM040013]MDX6851486.1 hypothetical protein [Gilvimarinus sp. SDUM040013]